MLRRGKKHLLSHQHIHFRFIYIDDPSEKNNLPNLIKVNKKDIFDFAVSKTYREGIKKNTGMTAASSHNKKLRFVIQTGTSMNSCE